MRNAVIARDPVAQAAGLAVVGDGASRQVAVVAVVELENSSFSPLNGVP